MEEEEEEENKQNPNIKKKKEKEKEKEKKKKRDSEEFEFCKVCKLNHDQGRRHNYFPNHTKSLSSFLSRFLKELSDVRFFLKNPTLLRPEHASNNRLWCVFCDSDIQELQSVFTCTNAINHLASSEHLKNLKNFLWKYGGGMDRVDSLRISETDLSKWEKRCRALNTSGPLSSERSNEAFLTPSKDIHNVLNSDNIDDLGKNITLSFNSSFSNGFVPLQRFTNEKHQEQLHTEITGVANGGALISDATSLKECSRDNQQIITVDSRGSIVGSSSNNKGIYQTGRHSNGENSKNEPKENVHSGAPPPWLKSEENQLNVHSSAGLQVNGLVSSLHKSGKSQKLNPKRVGAAWAEKRKIEMEMEKRGEIVRKDCDADWLPNFGRVWQSGSRRESRKQFEMEKEKLLNVDNLSEAPIKIQPYISKRMRKTNEESEGVVDSHLSEL